MNVILVIYSLTSTVNALIVGFQYAYNQNCNHVGLQIVGLLKTTHVSGIMNITPTSFYIHNLLKKSVGNTRKISISVSFPFK